MTVSPLWTDRGIPTWAALLVELENYAQMKKWGIQTHTPAEWGMILAEEEGELAKELLECHFEPHTGESLARARRIRDEAIQVATLALKIAYMASENGV